MTTAIPRALVADALGVDEEALPPGDLPVSRLAARFLAYLRAGDDDTPAPVDHPDAWTFALMDDLTRDHPALGLAATCAALAACETPEDVALIAAGPLEDLLKANGAEVIGEIETLAARAPRLGYALTGVWPPEQGAALLWARVRALTTEVAALDDGAPVPPPDGLVG
ncbi:MAG: hypothetical protein R3D80_17970 [Paracoccaceae bacterium]